MSAYVIFIREEMTDHEAFAQYAKEAPVASEGHPLTPLAFYGEHEVWEGDECDAVAVIEFPDMAAAKAWYEDPAYQAAMKHRHAGSKYRVIMVDGV